IIPTTTPVLLFTVAMALLVVSQVPPETVFDSVVVPPTHTFVVPVIAGTAGKSCTVMANVRAEEFPPAFLATTLNVPFAAAAEKSSVTDVSEPVIVTPPAGVYAHSYEVAPATLLMRYTTPVSVLHTLAFDTRKLPGCAGACGKEGARRQKELLSPWSLPPPII